VPHKSCHYLLINHFAEAAQSLFLVVTNLGEIILDGIEGAKRCASPADRKYKHENREK
jgi:hypothetical protein